MVCSTWCIVYVLYYMVYSRAVKEVTVSSLWGLCIYHKATWRALGRSWLNLEPQDFPARALVPGLRDPLNQGFSFDGPWFR